MWGRVHRLLRGKHVNSIHLQCRRVNQARSRRHAEPVQFSLLLIYSDDGNDIFFEISMNLHQTTRPRITFIPIPVTNWNPATPTSHPLQWPILKISVIHAVFLLVYGCKNSDRVMYSVFFIPDIFFSVCMTAFTGTSYISQKGMPWRTVLQAHTRKRRQNSHSKTMLIEE
jgi:hypothetical protein